MAIAWFRNKTTKNSKSCAGGGGAPMSDVFCTTTEFAVQQESLMCRSDKAKNVVRV